MDNKAVEHYTVVFNIVSDVMEHFLLFVEDLKHLIVNKGKEKKVYEGKVFIFVNRKVEDFVY